MLGSCHQAFENRFEGHKVTRFAAKAVSIGSDSLRANGMFLYTAMEELRMLREFSACDWHNHPKFNQSIVHHLFETCSALGLAPTSTLDHLPFHPVEVVKGGSQKEDNAAVPDQQLWLQAFLVGYGDPGCLARHRSALRLGNCWAGGMTGGEGPPHEWQAAMPGFRELGLRF